MLQALKAMLPKRQVVAEVADAETTLAAKNSFRSTYVKINGNPAAKLVLSLASLPMWLIDHAPGRSHCLEVSYQKE